MSEQIDNSALEKAAEIALQQAKKQGATQAEVSVSHSNGLSVAVRQGEVETLEYNNDKSLGITVYYGQGKASSSTSDMRLEAIINTIKATLDIAKHTEEDECSGLVDAELMATEFPDLSLYHPWDIDAEQAIALAVECEQAGLNCDAKISKSEGGSLSSHQSDHVYANSHGFISNTKSSRHSLVCALIADDERGMHRDCWYNMVRDAVDLQSAKYIGECAAKKTLRRLNARMVETGNYPVIFASDVAPSLFGKFISAISGSSLYRKSSFLLDRLDTQIFPEFIRIHEQPYLLKGLGSAAFDVEGVATKTHDLVTDGILQSYVLDNYSARKLNMTTTGNAGGVHNLTIDSGELDFNALLKEMGTGVLVTETMGMGVNIITGDYSQGASGCWVENGEIQYAIDGFTIASNLRDMFMGIQAVGNDIESCGSTKTGSVWIDNMMVAG